jgi:hypothetical protein
MGMRESWVRVLAGFWFACGGDGAPRDQPDGGGSGSEADAAPDPDAGTGVDGGAGAPDAAPIDAGPTDADAGPTEPVIDSVVVDGAFTEVHQGARFEIRVAGAGLEAVTDVVLVDGTVEAGSLVATDGEVRAIVSVDHRAEPGPRDVALRGPDVDVTAPAAIAVTPWVFGPAAGPGGRGTFESPMLLAEYGDKVASYGGRLQFLAGEHIKVSWAYFGDGVTLTGAGVDATTVHAVGMEFSLSTPGEPTSIRDLTLNGLVQASGFGALNVERVAMRGGSFWLSDYGDGRSVRARFDEFDYVGDEPGGAEAVIVGDGASTSVTLSRSRIASCSTALRMYSGAIVVTDSVIEGCEVGIRGSVRPTRYLPMRIAISVTGSELVDNGVAIEGSIAQIEVGDTVIADNEATAAPSRTGIYLCEGRLTATDVTIQGQDEAGINAIGCGSEYSSSLSLSLTRLLVEGGQVGVRTSDFADGGSFLLDSSIVRDQTVAAVSLGMDDVNGMGIRGDSQLSVVSGFALEDVRADPRGMEYIQARGVLLNGRPYSGLLVEGTASAPPDYRVVPRSGGIQF